MSNRSLFEINHDRWHVIDKAGAGEFERALLRYLGSASKENALALEPYGIRVFGMRHHSNGFFIQWGGHIARESATGEKPHPLFTERAAALVAAWKKEEGPPHMKASKEGGLIRRIAEELAEIARTVTPEIKAVS